LALQAAGAVLDLSQALFDGDPGASYKDPSAFAAAASAHE
jgi:hypothetical protein